MPNWIEPVVDRTIVDVEYARQTIDDWKAEIALGGTPTITDLKGCFNYTDLNRIEGNIEYLSFIGNVTSTHKTDWNASDIVEYSDLERIASNLHALMPTFNSPSALQLFGTQVEVNLVEQLILDTFNAFDSRIFKFTITTADTFTLPLEATGTYHFIINWGDDTSDTITTYNQNERTHTYSSAGTYEIEILGTCVGFRFVNSIEAPKMTEITQWGDLNIGTGIAHFYGCSNLIITATDTLKLTTTTTLVQTFRDCASITTIPNIGNWNTSYITDMSGLFEGCSSFNQSLVGWDCTSVTSYEDMFTGASSYNQDLSEVIKIDSVANGGSLGLYASGTYLSTANYDLLINSLYNQCSDFGGAKYGFTLSVGSTKYSSSVQFQRGKLANGQQQDGYEMIITDGGLET